MSQDKMNFDELREEVKKLRDSLAKMSRMYEDLLYNLDSDNIREIDANLTKIKNLQAESIVTNTIVTQSLYGERGYIAELTVDQLETSDKVRNYLNEDTSDVNYIKIFDQNIHFITASTDGATTEQAQDRNENLLYWTDDTFLVTTLKVTEYPVTVYVYTEQIKAKIAFDLVDEVYIPRITLGAGTGVGDNDKAFISKIVDKYVMEYYTDTGERVAIEMDADGIHFIGGTTSSDVQVWVQADTPAEAKTDDVWVDTDDYSRYGKRAYTTTATVYESTDEFITVNGTFTLTLHAGTNAGIIKKIYNIGTGVVTIAGTINGVVNMLLYPGESVELITDGTNWRC